MSRCVVVALAVFATYEIVRFRVPTCKGCNIVLISADTLRADHLGCYGYARDTSHAIDRLARTSVFFERAYSASAWTQPGHMAMLSGRYPIRESEMVFMSRQPFPESYEMLPELLQRAGYSTTALVGGGWVRADLGFAQGFDSFSQPGRNLRDLGDDVVRWLDAHRDDRPFFLFLHGYDVHEPYVPPEYLRFRFMDPDEVPPACRDVELRCNMEDAGCRNSRGGFEYLISQYDALIVGVDRFIDTLVSELERRRLLDRTVLVFTSDHGEELMEGGRGGCGHSANLFEAVLRVPLIVHVPHMDGRRIPQRVSLVDLAPTLLDIVALPPPATSHGRTLIPLLETGDGERMVYSATGSDRGTLVMAAIDGSAKLVKSRKNRTEQWRYALFDLEQDPRGTADLLPEQGPPPPTYFDLLAKLERWQDEIGFESDGASPAVRATLPADAVEQLRALGYQH